MIAAIPGWVRVVIRFLICLILLIIAGLIVHAMGGGLLSLHAGHFVFELGAT